MKVITDYTQLVEKTIAFAHIAQFSEQITIATTDKEVFMAAPTLDDDGDIQILNYHESSVVKAIQESEYLQKELGSLGIFDLESYRLKKEKERKIALAKYQEEKEEKERRQYEKLKAKFGD